MSRLENFLKAGGVSMECNDPALRRQIQNEIKAPPVQSVSSSGYAVTTIIRGPAPK